MFAHLYNIKKLKYHIYISIQTLYSVLCWSTFRAPYFVEAPLLKHLFTQPRVFLGMTLQTWHTCIWEVSPILLCRSSHALSSWMGSVAAQQFSVLSIDVRSGSSPGSGWATQGHSVTCPEATPVLPGFLQTWRQRVQWFHQNRESSFSSSESLQLASVWPLYHKRLIVF